MAHIKSAKKRVRQIKKRTIRNRVVKTNYRERIKECRAAIVGGDQALALAAFKKAESAIASAVSKGVLHHNTADRHVSRLNLALNKLKAAAK